MVSIHKCLLLIHSTEVHSCSKKPGKIRTVTQPVLTKHIDFVPPIHCLPLYLDAAKRCIPEGCDTRDDCLQTLYTPDFIHCCDSLKHPSLSCLSNTRTSACRHSNATCWIECMNTSSMVASLFPRCQEKIIVPVCATGTNVARPSIHQSNW